MSQFLKNVFSSCLGVTLAFLLLFVLGIFFVGALAGSSGEKSVSVGKNSVLHLTFGKPVPEQTNNIEMGALAFQSDDILGLNAIVETLEHAAKDDKIKGIYINPENGLSMGLASAATIREAIVKFKESGKFVIANSKYYTQGAYYLASAADTVYVNPLGGIDFHGFSAMIPFFKDMLDRVGIKMEVFYAGDFKSATEPFRLNEMTDKNRLQMRAFLEPVYTHFLTDIGASRKKDVATLRGIADGLKVRTAEDAVALGLADKIGYVDEVIADMKQRMGIKADDELNVVSLEDYATSFTQKKDYKAKDRIALVFAEGNILMDKGERGSIVDQKYVKLIREIRKDEKIKAIVLRVNSGGGSAIASENIWRELQLAKEAGKKIVVSMGDYAASGGYYIACNADKIVAEPNTLTGSIGVFSMMPNASKLFEEKLGIHWDTVKTAKYSTGVNPFYDIAPVEAEHLQYSTEAMYATFLKRVADGRQMTTDSVHQIAQGRVWIGEKAKQIGLVDEIGDLDRAIELAAELSGIEKYRLLEYPKQIDPIQELINEITGEGGEKGIHAKAVEKELGEIYPNYRQVKSWLTMKGVQARLPVIIDFN
ncbi:MAG: signal peptide peptidase SppA [Saprospiraceae bacterium]|nr:signal peptide peptidase SppA [Saprospiraceae bacterium]